MSREERVVYLGVPKSMKQGDNRIAVPPEGVGSLGYSVWDNGFERTKLKVLVEEGAGVRSGFGDERYLEAGAEVVSFDEILEKADVLVDVKQRPEEGLLANGVNIFYAHVEKGQGPEQLDALLARGGVTAISPETFGSNGTTYTRASEALGNRRGTNLGFYSGIGGAHLLLEGLKLSAQLRDEGVVPFEFFPEVDGASYEDILRAYEQIGDLETGLKLAVIGGKNGLVANGAMAELRKAGLDFDLLYKDVTMDQDRLAEIIRNYDGILNASRWNPGDSRMITQRQIAAMKLGTVFIDDTCDQDGSSTINGPGNPIVGGVRYSFESKWGDKNTFYWAGEKSHTFNGDNPREFDPDSVRVLFNANGMIPGGTSTAKAASKAYFGMVFPYLVNVLRAVSQGSSIPDNGVVVRDGKINHPDLRELVVSDPSMSMYKGFL